MKKLQLLLSLAAILIFLGCGIVKDSPTGPQGPESPVLASLTLNSVPDSSLAIVMIKDSEVRFKTPGTVSIAAGLRTVFVIHAGYDDLRLEYNLTPGVNNFTANLERTIPGLPLALIGFNAEPRGAILLLTSLRDSSVTRSLVTPDTASFEPGTAWKGRYTFPGYEDLPRVYVFSQSGNINEIMTRLPDSPVPATVAFNTRPFQGATVDLTFVADTTIHLEFVTPATVSLRLGAWKARYTLPGYPSFPMVYSIDGSQTITETFTQSPRTTGYVHIVASTPGSVGDSIVSTTVDGHRAKLDITHFSIRDTIMNFNLVDGQGNPIGYTLYASASGFVSEPFGIPLSSEDMSTLPISLEALPLVADTMGKLVIISFPTDASFVLYDLAGNRVVSGTTNKELTLPPACYTVSVLLDNYQPAPANGSGCVNAGAYSDITVVLTHTSAPVPRTTSTISADKLTITLGDSVRITASTMNAIDRFISPENIRVTGTDSTVTFIDKPFSTKTHCQFAVGVGNNDLKCVTVTVLPPEPNLVLDSIMVTLRDNSCDGVAVNVNNPSKSLGSQLIPAHNGPVQISLLASYSGDVRGQRDEAIAVSVNGAYALRTGDVCPVLPDNPSYRGDVWVEMGTVAMAANQAVPVVATHGKMFSCYRPVENFQGGDESVRVLKLKIRYWH